MEETVEKMQFAVLIDADNISSRYAATIFEEMEKYGFSTCRRIYGNWSKGNGWTEETLLEYSTIPVQQFSYTTGKNATDMAMVIDAMDILYKDKVQGFCLVTSDSDFTRLAMRLREENKFVLGMGESKTPLALTRACNKFIYLNLIAEQNKDSGAVSVPEGSDAEQYVTSLEEIKQAILGMLNDTGEGGIELGLVGSRLNERFTDFDVRNYGYSKLSVMILEELQELNLQKVGHRTFIKRGDSVSKEELEQYIIKMIERSGGVIENLSTINDELHKTYSHLDLKEYGYSRISSFLRSLKTVTVRENAVFLKK